MVYGTTEGEVLKLDRPRNILIAVLFLAAVLLFLFSLFRIINQKTFDYTTAMGTFGSLAAVVLIIVQLAVSVEQSDMMRTQTQILQNQDAILNARPVMLLTWGDNTKYFGPLNLQNVEKTEMLCSTTVHNQGDADAVSYTVEILVPWYNDTGEELTLIHNATQMSNAGHFVWSMRNWIRYKKIIDQPVMAGDHAELALLVFDIPSKTMKWDIGWRIIVGDKVYPANGLYGMLELSVEA